VNGVVGNGPVRVRAHAKLTLSLRVLGRRPDGFHELDALTVSVSEPSDTLALQSRGIGNQRTVVVPGAT
jgi:4-diphosphocytidyl-2C-methyl-D-erythritol kinase